MQSETPKTYGYKTEVSNKHHCKLDKNFEKFFFRPYLVIFEYYTSVCIVPIFISKQEVQADS